MQKPVIILLGTQLGENIGMVARAMLNFGLDELRLVAPRAGWCRERAHKSAAGADALIDAHQAFATLEAAIADLHFLVATTARARDMVKPVVTPQAAIKQIRAHNHSGVKTGILFGPERTGLDNEALSHADILCRVPLNPHFSSLNLAQAVLLFAYEWHLYADDTPAHSLPMPDTYPAERGALIAMFAHLEAALDATGFLSPPEKRPAMVRNIRNLFHRAQLTAQDIRTFRGIINALLRWPDKGGDKEIRARMAAISRGQTDLAAKTQENDEKS